jgi:hypothetical protein
MNLTFRQDEGAFTGVTTMGGKNHQPCNRFFSNSTQLSLAHSLVGIQLEKTNVRLEYELLAEMEGKKANISNILVGVAAFKHALSSLTDKVEILRLQMKAEHYVDLPTINSPMLDIAGRKMADRGMISWPAFVNALAIYRKGSFYSMLDLFDGHVSHLEELADKLAAKMEKCSDACSFGKFQDELEENGDGNLRPEFAKLYTAWNQFNELFLASSLVSTEAFYMTEGVGSLTDVQHQQPVVV